MLEVKYMNIMTKSLSNPRNSRNVTVNAQPHSPGHGAGGGDPNCDVTTTIVPPSKVLGHSQDPHRISLSPGIVRAGSLHRNLFFFGIRTDISTNV